MFDFRNPERASPSEHVSRFHELDAELCDFLVKDDEGVLSVVDEVRADGTILVACGWFGRRSGNPTVEETRAAGSALGRLIARLVGRGMADRSRAQSRHSR